MSSVAVRLIALVLVGVLALPPLAASADDPADLRRSITALRQSLSQLREPPNLMLERDLSPLERLQRWVGVGLRKEHVGQYSDLWLQARSHQSFAALEVAVAENLLDVGAVESARKHLGYASANLRARHLYDEAASDVWRGDLTHAQGALLEAGKTVADRRIKIPPLYPAYLLLDLPEPRRNDVRRAIEARSRTYDIETVTGLANTIIRVMCREAELASIRDDCLSNGAVDAKALLVLRREPRSA